MDSGPTEWTVTFRGCGTVHDDCDAAHFQVTPSRGAGFTVEVRTTSQIEHLLAQELGKEALDTADREAILSTAGQQIIEELLAARGTVERMLLLDSRLFRVPGAERRLLRECGLLQEHNGGAG